MSQPQLVTTPARGNSGSIGATRPGGSPLNYDEVNTVVGLSINQTRQEVDDAFQDMEKFHSLEPDEIMRLAAGHSARLSYIRVRVMRIEDFQRQWKDIRTRELEPALEQLREQWAHGSRLHSTREFDWKIESGER